jgi:hypothetical protein
LLVLLAVLLAGCKVRGEVVIRMDSDGTGSVSVSVRLDADAVERLERIAGGSPAERIRVLDFVAAGWDTDGWRAAADGGQQITLVHGFDAPEQVPDLVAQVVGDTDVLRDVQVEIEESAFRVSERMSVTADLSSIEAGVDDDERLAAALTGLGVDPEAIDLVLTSELRDALTVRAVVATERVRDTAVVDAGESATAAVDDEHVRTGRVVLAVAAGACALLGLLALGGAARSGLRAHRRRSHRTFEA